ncbi:uncharacterized protein LOC131648640 [Vicia villosa]|uniref:uncharacterized protein LOC131648640 n=1 Tax=Vicia villosa TaxID=3911 RepID=UPI00273C842A|nr:uncharacterized protein LOC131648640 [Vicia villosa]
MENFQSNLPTIFCGLSVLLWKRIWKAPVHNRVRNFLWRASKDILPTKINLSKKVKLAPDFPLCQNQVETSDHLFLHYNVSKQVWFLSPLGLRIPPSTGIDYWIDKMLNVGDSYGSQLFSVILWKMWSWRNRVVFNKEAFNPQQVVNEAIEWIHDYNTSNLGKGGHRTAVTVEGFEGVNNETMMVHVDTGCFEDGTIAMGCVMKEASKGVFLSATRKQAMEVDPTMAEALALCWALKTVVDLKITKAVFHSDAMSVVDCINRISFDAVLEPIIVDCLELLESFSAAVCLYISRTCNMDAHNLVGIGHKMGSRTWLGKPSSEVSIVYFSPC